MDSNLASAESLMIGSHYIPSYTENSIFTPTEAFGIDQKIDDGRPYNGKVLGLFGATATEYCTSGSGDNAVYALSQTKIQCWMWFRMN